MNHHWANEFARQRHADLSAEARGDQLVRMAQLDRDDAASERRGSLLARLFARVRALTGWKVIQAHGPGGR